MMQVTTRSTTTPISFRGQRQIFESGLYDQEERELGSSRVLFAAPRIAKLRLQVDGGAEKTWSEYEQLMSEIAPVLDGTAVSDLVQEKGRHEVTFVAAKIGQPEERIAA
jgi:hypothetical protein